MVMSRLLPCLALCAALTVAPVPALSQEEGEPVTSSAEDRIVVRGGRPENVSRTDVHRQARDITVSGSVLHTPLARFEDPLCPGIMGMQVEYAQLMVDRIRANARYLDLRVLEDNCRPNFIVVFAEDGREMLAELMDRNPARFRWLHSYDRREMLEPGPVHVFTDLQPTTRDGIAVGRGRDQTRPPVARAAMAHSRIYTATQNDITLVMIFIDIDAANGLSIGQLADYATMRGLVRTRPPDDTAMDSILELFNPQGASPSRLTDFDRAYLRAVYSRLPNMPGAMKLGVVTRELRQIAEERAEEVAASME